MSYYMWLGRDAEEIMRGEEDRLFFRNEVKQRQIDCKPEADGFITVHPKVRRRVSWAGKSWMV